MSGADPTSDPPVRERPRAVQRLPVTVAGVLDLPSGAAMGDPVSAAGEAGGVV